jgi:hypothetical protein
MGLEDLRYLILLINRHAMDRKYILYKRYSHIRLILLNIINIKERKIVI